MVYYPKPRVVTERHLRLSVTHSKFENILEPTESDYTSSLHFWPTYNQTEDVHVSLLAFLHHSSICFPFWSCSLFRYSLVDGFNDQIRKFWQLLMKSSKMLWGLFGSELLSSLWNDKMFLVVSTLKRKCVK